VQIDFDIAALFHALDSQRRSRALSWQAVAQELWDQSAALNARRDDHPISSSTLTGMVKRRDTTCQHALFMLRWDLQKLYDALDSQRRERGFTWPQLAHELQCSPSQLSGIKRKRFAIGMRLAMRIVTWLGRPARDFVHAANW
jgi:uncharacterized protein YfiM (DUF2279 family)